MSHWIRTRRAGLLVLAVLCVAGVGVAAGAHRVTVPTYFGVEGNDLLIATFLPVLWGAAVADIWGSCRQACEVRPTGRLRRGDTLLFVLGSLAGAVGFSVAVGQRLSAVDGVGPILIASGLACAVTLWLGPGAGVFTVSTLVLFTSVYAINAPQARYVRVFQSDGDQTWSLTCGLTAMAIAIWILLTDRVAMRLGSTEGGD